VTFEHRFAWSESYETPNAQTLEPFNGTNQIVTGMSLRVLILFAHPAFQKSRINRRLLRAVQGLENVRIHDLYEEYPDFQIDVEREQKLLLDHDIIVLQHPFFWYSGPALLKEWEDLVLEYGFAYGVGGTMLAGKRMLSAITTGGPEAAYRRVGYNYFTIREFLTPFEQTVRFCHMEYLPPFVVFGSFKLFDEQVLAERATAYRRVIEGLRDERFDLTQSPLPEYFNDILAAQAHLV
jgi:glutathione-regulated potassium-efflux system ancillary protein KefG